MLILTIANSSNIHFSLTIMSGLYVLLMWLTTDIGWHHNMIDCFHLYKT